MTHNEHPTRRHLLHTGAAIAALAAASRVVADNVTTTRTSIPATGRPTHTPFPCSVRASL